MSTQEQQTETGAVRDNVEVSYFNAEQLRNHRPDWEQLDSDEQLSVLDDLEPVSVETSHNATTQTYRARLRQVVNPDLDVDPLPPFTHLAFGDDETEPDASDTHLKNEVYRDEIDVHTDDPDSEEFHNVVLLRPGDAVGKTLIEAALVSEASPGHADDLAANRFILEDPDDRLRPKTADWIARIRIALRWRDQSEVLL